MFSCVFIVRILGEKDHQRILKLFFSVTKNHGRWNPEKDKIKVTLKKSHPCK